MGLSKTDEYLLDEYFKYLLNHPGVGVLCGDSMSEEAIRGFVLFAKTKGYELFDRKSIERLQGK
jgi:hypothetical protein